MPAAKLSRIELELEPGADPIRGRIRQSDGTERPFWGWLELIDEVGRLAADRPPSRTPELPQPKTETHKETLI